MTADRRAPHRPPSPRWTSLLLGVLVAACAGSGGDRIPLGSAAGPGSTADRPSPTARIAAGPSPTPRPTPVPRPSLDAGVGEPAPSFAVADAGSEFDSPGALDGWRMTQGEPMDGGRATAEVAGGVLRVRAAQSQWIRSVHAFGLARTIEGDVVVTARVRALGNDGRPNPDVDWSLAGIMLRAPVPAGGRENWVHASVGFVARPVLERKNTVNSQSRLSLIDIPGGWTEVRLVRAGDAVLVLHRPDGGAWSLDFTYRRPDLPPALEMLLTAQSGAEGDHADLVAEFDWVRVRRSPLAAATVAGLLAGSADVARVIATLGD